MITRLLKETLEKAVRRDGVVVFGAGESGQELVMMLSAQSNIRVLEVFDNNPQKVGSVLCGVKVGLPRKLDGDVLYIVSICSSRIRDEVISQLLTMGIAADDIAKCYKYRDYEYCSALDPKDYKDEVTQEYFEIFGKEINWEHPTTYTEIINWEKFNFHDERRTVLADKMLARDHVGAIIGEKYLTKRYGQWLNAEDIDFALLPDAFVLKCNHGSGFNIVVKDKTTADFAGIRRQLSEWMACDYTRYSGMFEFHYQDIPRRIFCEEYLEGLAETVYDYNIYCFHGEPVFIWCIKGSHRPGCTASFYDRDWNQLEFSFGYPKDEHLAPRPKKLDEMMELSKILCKDFEHIRVDWYNLPDGRLLFGEMTFTSWAGFNTFSPPEYDKLFGDLITGVKKYRDGKIE